MADHAAPDVVAILAALVEGERWLCRLVTPAGGLILDPFAGSGSTGRGALLEGFQFTGIELDPEYAAIAEARIRAVQPGLPFGDAA